MKKIIVKIRSVWLLIVIFFDKLLDQSFRLIMGIPTLKRSQITANLFLGGQYNLRGLRVLRKLGITSIINMRVASIYRQVHYNGFNYLHLPTPDNTAPKLDDLVKGAEFASNEIAKGGKVYIHCRQGLGRGPSMAMAYLLKKGATYNDALATIKRVRTFINPTKVQVMRLKELESYFRQMEEDCKSA